MHGRPRHRRSCRPHVDRRAEKLKLLAKNTRDCGLKIVTETKRCKMGTTEILRFGVAFYQETEHVQKFNSVLPTISVLQLQTACRVNQKITLKLSRQYCKLQDLITLF